LFAIPIAVFAVAFIVGWLIHQLGIVNTIISGLVLAILACFLQIFFTNITPLWYVIIAFVCLGSMWAMGNTVPLIAAQTAVGSSRSSVATGTMVTMFNVGGSIGLAIAVVVYHSAGMNYLKHFFQMHPQQLSSDQRSQLEGLILNPAQSLKPQIDTFIHSIFNDAFMQGFSGVMWFLFALSVLMLLSILIFKMSKRDSDQGNA
jgi:MFS family permease